MRKTENEGLYRYLTLFKSIRMELSRGRPNKKINVFRVTSLKILGRVGTHIFRIGTHNFFFWKKNIILCILKGISPFKMHKIIFFSNKT